MTREFNVFGNPSVRMNDLGALVPSVETYVDIQEVYNRDLAQRIAKWVQDSLDAVKQSQGNLPLSSGFGSFLVYHANRIHIARWLSHSDTPAVANPQDNPSPLTQGRSIQILGTIKREILQNYAHEIEIRRILRLDRPEIDLSAAARRERFAELQNRVLGS